MKRNRATRSSRPITTATPVTVTAQGNIRVLEVASPSSFQGWEAIETTDPSKKGLVLSDEYSENLHAHVLTVDWNDAPPEVLLLNRKELLGIENGYLLIRTAGRNLGFCRLPFIHQCGPQCNVHLNDTPKSSL